MVNADVTLIFPKDLSLIDIVDLLSKSFEIRVIPSVGSQGRLILELNNQISAL